MSCFGTKDFHLDKICNGRDSPLHLYHCKILQSALKELIMEKFTETIRLFTTLIILLLLLRSNKHLCFSAFSKVSKVIPILQHASYAWL